MRSDVAILGEAGFGSRGRVGDVLIGSGTARRGMVSHGSRVGAGRNMISLVLV